MQQPVSRRAWVAWALTCVALALWILRWLWGSELPPGLDVTGHLQRLDFASDQLFASGRLDGWFDRSMLGYQTFLVYGPGLAFTVVLLRAASFGLLSTAGGYELVGLLSFVAVPFAVARLCRSLGLDRHAAFTAAVLSLAVSSDRGGGVEGAFVTGLMANQLAVPLVLLAWSLLIDLAAGPGSRRRRRPVLLASTVAFIALSHPQSAAIWVFFAPLVLLAGQACDVVDFASWRKVGGAALLTVGFSAWWWYPALLHRDLRGPLTSWDLPSLSQHLGLVLDGKRGWLGVTGRLVALVVPTSFLVGLVRRDQRALSLALLPGTALLTLHTAQELLDGRLHEAILFPNRGFAYAAYLAAPIAGLALSAVANLGARRWKTLSPNLSWLLAGTLVVHAFWSFTIPADIHQNPDPQMHETAGDLATRVPDGGRFAFVGRWPEQLGVPAPGRWLAWASGVPSLGPFGPEYAPGSGPTLMVFDPPLPETVDDWVERARKLAVTHIVVGQEEMVLLFARANGLDIVAEHQPMTIFAIGASNGRPVGSVIDSEAATVLTAETERVVVEVSNGADRPDAQVAIGYSPGWTARLDGRPVALGRTSEGMLSIDLPVGVHTVELSFQEVAAGRIARSLSLGLALGLTVASAVRLIATRGSAERPRPDLLRR